MTIGTEKPFFGFLKNVGMSREAVESEIVDRDLAPVIPIHTAKSAKTKKPAQAKAKTKAKAKAKVKKK